MSKHPLFMLTVSAFALTACNPFHHEQAVEVSAADVNLNARWHANLASPAELAGIVQMNGTASMAPGPKSGTTLVTLTLANATPGGVHPWQLRLGQCGAGADEGVFGTADAYQPVAVDRDGRGSASATLALQTPTTGSYFVVVRASAANAETTVACGNLAPPTQ
jgi:hypothetical protein